MAADDDARLIGSIADAVAYAGVRRGGDALLYAEAGPGWVGGSLFIDHPSEIEWVNPEHYHIGDLVLRLWTSPPDAKRWRALTMIVGEKVFRTEFDYGEGWSDEQDESDRREPIVRRFFGDKPIVYSALDGDGTTYEVKSVMMFRNG